MQDDKDFPKAVDSATLITISQQVMGQLADPELSNVLQYGDYHGFMKARLPEKILDTILSPRGLTPDDVQIEIIRVMSDLTDQVHHHSDATAYVTTLGEQQGYPNPRNAYFYLHNGWRPSYVGDKIRINAGTAHGFTVDGDGELYFLSVQSPAIVRQQGKDDYEQHEPVPLHGNIMPRSRSAATGR